MLHHDDFQGLNNMGNGLLQKPEKTGYTMLHIIWPILGSMLNVCNSNKDMKAI